MTYSNNRERLDALGNECDHCHKPSEPDNPLRSFDIDGWFHAACYELWLGDEKPNVVVATFPSGDQVNLTYVERLFSENPDSVGMVIDEEQTEAELRFDDDPDR